LGFLWFCLFNRLFFNSSSSRYLLCRLLIFIFVEFVFNVTNVSFSSTLFSRSILSTGSTSSIEGVTLRNTFNWSSLPVVSYLFSIISNSCWKIWVCNSCSNSGGLLITKFFFLSSLFVSLYKKWNYLFWLCQFCW
jgi:hypothetical protein